MGSIDMEELVFIYNEVLEHDNRSNGIRLFVYKNKEDFIRKYVEDNLLQLKVQEPNHGERYEDKFDNYLKNINAIIKPFKDNEAIIVGVFGKYVDKLDIGNSDVRVYDLDNLQILIDDIENAYK